MHNLRPSNGDRSRSIVRAPYAAAIRRLLGNSLFQQTLIVFAATMSANALNYVFHKVMGHVLSVEDYGVLPPLLNLVQILGIPSAIATIVVAKYAAEFHAVGDAAKLRRLWTTNVIGALAVGAVAFIAMVLVRGQLSQFMMLLPHQAPAVVMTAILVFGTLAVPGIRGTLQGMQSYRSFGLVLFTEGLVKFVSAVLLVRAGYGVAGAMLGCAIGLWVSNVLGLALLARTRASSPERLRLDLRRLATTMMGVGGATVVTTMLSFADVLLVKHYFSPFDAGTFAAISLGGKILLFVVSFLPTMVLPRATALVKSGQSPLPVLKQAAALMLAVTVVGLVSYAFLGKYVILLTLDAKFLAGVPLMFPYAVAMIFLGALTIVSAYKTGLHRFDFVVPIGIVAALEIAAIAWHHESLAGVLRILVVGHGLAFLVSLNGILDGAPRLRGTVVESSGMGLRARFIRRRPFAPGTEKPS